MYVVMLSAYSQLLAPQSVLVPIITSLAISLHANQHVRMAESHENANLVIVNKFILLHVELRFSHEASERNKPSVPWFNI